MFAPIAVFGYRRPSHLHQALKAIETNPESLLSEVYIFIDGPKPGADNRARFEECQAVASLGYKFGSTRIISRDSNLGLARSIRSGLDYILETHESVIVIEDDIILAPSALNYLNRGLDKYQDNPMVSSIHTYQYPLSHELNDCVALRGADCWGWATWKNRWVSTSFEPKLLLSEIREKGLLRLFDLDGNMDYSRMLRMQEKGRIDSWAICWHASMFLQNRYCIYPPKSLSLNIGSDGSGTHSGDIDIFQTELSNTASWMLPDKIDESDQFRRLLMEFYAKKKPPRSIFQKILAKLELISGKKIND
jgi:hypothetical protein